LAEPVTKFFASAGKVTDMRFHLSFEYELNGKNSCGEEVVVNDDGLEAAAMVMARSRGVSSIFVKKRFFSGKPASQAEIINRLIKVTP
jgi:hypothetical protein